MFLIILSVLILILVAGVFSYIVYTYVQKNEELEKENEQEKRRRETQRYDINKVIISIQDKLGSLDTKHNRLDRSFDDHKTEVIEIHDDILPKVKKMNNRIKEIEDNIDELKKIKTSEDTPSPEELEKSIEDLENLLQMHKNEQQKSITLLQEKIIDLEERELNDFMTDNDTEILIQEIKDNLESLSLQTLGINNYQLKKSVDSLNPDALKIRNNQVSNDGIDVNNISIRDGRLSFIKNEGGEDSNPYIKNDDSNLEMILPSNDNSFIIKSGFSTFQLHSLNADGSCIHRKSLSTPEIIIGPFVIRMEDGKLIAKNKNSQVKTTIAT